MSRAWWTIIIGIILIIAGCGLLFGYRPLTSTTADDLCDDWNSLTGQFSSYSPGDTIKILDEINDIEYISEHPLTGEPLSWTQITFKSVGLKIADLTSVITNPSDIWGYIIFKGDLTDSFKVGDRVEVMVTVTTFRILGETLEILDWIEELEQASYNPDKLNKDSFAELDVANRGDIQHANIYPEILFCTGLILGIFLLAIGIVKVQRTRTLLGTIDSMGYDRAEKQEMDRTYNGDFSYDEHDKDKFSVSSTAGVGSASGYKDSGQYYEDLGDESSDDIVKPISTRIEDNIYYSTKEPKRPDHTPPRYHPEPIQAPVVTDVTFKRVSTGTSYENYYSTYESAVEAKRDTARQVPKKPEPEVIEYADFEEDIGVTFKRVSKPMSHKQYIASIKTKQSRTGMGKGHVKSDYLGKIKSKPTEIRARGKRLVWEVRKTGKSTKDTDEGTEVTPLEIRHYDRPKKHPKKAVQCNKCKNVMFLSIPYKPYEYYCDKCGNIGIIR